MIAKVLVLFSMFSFLCPCCGDKELAQNTTELDIPLEPIDASSQTNFNNTSESWRFWRAWKFWRKEMHRIDSQRTVHHESSLFLSKRSEGKSCETYFTSGKFNLSLGSESTIFLMSRPRGSVQREVVTYMFDAMLDSIVESWETINPVKKENKQLEKVTSNLLPPKRKRSLIKSSRSSKPKFDFNDESQDESNPLTWWSSPDERAIIRFRNGNIYEGNISMKVMHGEGCFKWADGTVYKGRFNENEIKGRGLIQWKDDTWYEGEFVGNLRHGQGLYVDSRNQCSYIGRWCSGSKHGRGVIYYSQTFKNSYDGQWVYNVRHGFGSREYCPLSGYDGEWDYYVRDGKGLMIWPNHDFYRGEWKNGVMSGCGTYIWDAYNNNSLSHPTVIIYRGQWLKGERHGCGLLNFGLDLGAQYSGEFRNNQKHGAGMLVSNNGFILQNKQLFQDDNLSNLETEDADANLKVLQRETVFEPYRFDICDSSVGLCYHVKQAIKHLDRQQEIRNTIIDEFIENNKAHFDIPLTVSKEYCVENICNDLIYFELRSLQKALQCYESDLKRIYYKYSTILNTEEITFTPILIRLYLWQMYYDCNIHKKGLTLVEIDNIFAENPKWLAQAQHCPFEPILFWQFIHSLISIASRLYAKKQMPGPKPDTILACAFREFMEKDILPGVQEQKGKLVNGYGEFIPLKSVYTLYESLGEPHTLLTYLRAVRRAPHEESHFPPAFIQNTNNVPLQGHNVFIFSDEINYIIDSKHRNEPEKVNESECEQLKLFNFGNLPSKTLISIFSKIFPQVYEDARVLNLDIEITFLEFFEIFVRCAIKSAHKIDKEREWLDNCQLEGLGLIAPPQSRTGLY